ncbi:MAG TPA: alpha/beta hydrolase [Rhodocyclaceae bacterium]|nr:alpha/beta hydrolase [Rhodocyclaceae bacterium]
MKPLVSALISVALLAVAAPAPVQAETKTPSVRNVVLVHGAFADGAGWRGVYNQLTSRGYKVSVVQNPLTSLEDDVAATNRVLARQDGPAILVGHSYGGAVITQAGDNPVVAGLVYVAAFAPEIGQSVLDQYADIPPPPNFKPEEQKDGFAFLQGESFRAGFAADVSAKDAAFLRDSQVPVALAALKAKMTTAAWKTKPSWYVVATEDGAISPELLRKTAKRINARTTEVKGSHVVFLSQPKAVADVIDAAARGALAAAR